MEVFVVGLNHKTAPLEMREKFSIPAHKAPELLKALEDRQIFEERLLLSTCNRTELYGAGDAAGDSLKKAKEFLSDYAHVSVGKLEEKLYVLKQPDSVSHLFSVASGLDSMVLGETEIIGQVKDAYFAAHENRHTGKVLNALFQKSFKVAKNLRTQTEIGLGKVSVASVAVDLAEKIFDPLKGVRVLLIGTGEMSQQLAKGMIGKGAKATIVSSRHHDRAEEIAAELGAEASHYDTYESLIPEVDVLIASTLAPRVLIHEKQVRTWMKARSGRPLFMIDIAVPRNIDILSERIDNVYLYNIDDLQSIAKQNMALRESQLEECFRLVKHQTEFYMGWLGKEFGVA